MNRVSKILWTILGTAAVIFCVLIGISYFDLEDMELALGKSFDTSKGWTVTYEDGSQKTDVATPYNVPLKNSSVIVLERKLSAEMAGLALNFEADNAALRAYVDGKPILEEGFTSSGSGFQRMFRKAEQNSEPASGTISPDKEVSEENDTAGSDSPDDSGNTAADSGNLAQDSDSASSGALSDSGSFRERRSLSDRNSVENILKRDETNVQKEEAGAVEIELPGSVTDESTLRIKLVRVDAKSRIYIHQSNISQKDAVLISLLRGAVFPLICCLIMLIAIFMLLMMDYARTVFHYEKKALNRLALFGVDALLYTFVGTNILSVLFGNKEFFYILENLCYFLMPMLLIFYFAAKYINQYPKQMTLLIWLTSLSALGQTALLYFGVLPMKRLSLYSFLLQFFVIGIIAYGRFQSGTAKKLHIISGMDEAALACLLISSVINPLQLFWHETSLLSTVKIIGMTGFFVLTAIRQAQLLINEYRNSVKESKRILEYEVRLVETRNAELTAAQAQAEAAKQEAIVANEAKGRFLASMSHEIRTPINAVLGMDEMILRESREPDIRGYAMDIYSSGQTLLSLINDILDLSKIESGKMEIVPGDYDVSSMIHDLVNMTNVRAKNKDLAFEVSVDSQIPSKYWGDDVRIRQVLTNILTNAVKYTPEGNIWFRISGKQSGETEVLHFEVEDTGIGIKEEDLPKLFEEFQRIEEDRNRNIEGTGLGMNITLQLLQMMGSRLQVESIYGKGSKFYFDLKQKITDKTPIGDFEERIKHLSETYSYSEGFLAPEAKILVVDDNSMNRKVFMSLLKPTRIQITEAEGGQEAINLASREYFDLIFMDHMMPGIDGVEALHRLRALDEYPCKDTPVFVLTANAVTGAKEQYLADGFDGFLSKPIVSAKLEKTIREYLPEEKVLPAPEGEGGVGDGESTGTDAGALPDALSEELPVVDGLDWQLAWLHLSDKDLLADTVKDFYQIINAHADKLQKMYETLPESLSDYRILVHAMKSTAATIGIIPLAGMAKILEFAARDENTDIIRSLHDVYLAEWKSYREKLKGVFDIGMDTGADKTEADPAIIQMLLSVLGDAMEEMDVDEADKAMAKLDAYRYSEEVAEEMENLKAAVADLDSDLADEVIQNILGIL